MNHEYISNKNISYTKDEQFLYVTFKIVKFTHKYLIKVFKDKVFESEICSENNAHFRMRSRPRTLKTSTHTAICRLVQYLLIIQ